MTTLTLPLARRGSQVAAVLAVSLGHVIGWGRARLPLVPGLAGAAMVSWGTAMVYLPAGIMLGGVLLLLMDHQIKLRPPV